MLSEVAGGLAHNFNNVLSVIALTAFECIESPDVGPEVRAKLQTISNTAHDAAQLVKRLAQFSRTRPLQAQPVAINELIRKVLVLIEPLVGSKRIDVISNLGPDLPDVDVDSVEMEQVFLNLMLNARDAMPNGGKLTISTEAGILPSDAVIRDDGKQGLAITVSDTGSGIAASDLNHIFKPFFTTKANGTGLGLASAYGIVRQHGGDIKVQSTPGSGTRFTVYLPPSHSKEQLLHGRPAKAA
jgi:signal transduction histidine kinase